MITGPGEISVDRRKRLRGFYRKISQEDVVVVHDPAILPIPGVASTGGFAYMARTESDGPTFVRDNEYTTIHPAYVEQLKLPRDWESIT